MIMVGLVPLHKRPVFTSFLGMAFGVSSVLGPIMGGLFTDSPYVGIVLFDDANANPSPVNSHGVGVSTSTFPLAVSHYW